MVILVILSQPIRETSRFLYVVASPCAADGWGEDVQSRYIGHVKGVHECITKIHKGILFLIVNRSNLIFVGEKGIFVKAQVNPKLFCMQQSVGIRFVLMARLRVLQVF